MNLGIRYPQRQISPTFLLPMSIRRNSHPGIREKEEAKLSVGEKERDRKIIPCLSIERCKEETTEERTGRPPKFTSLTRRR